MVGHLKGHVCGSKSPGQKACLANHALWRALEASEHFPIFQFDKGTGTNAVLGELSLFEVLVEHTEITKLLSKTIDDPWRLSRGRLEAFTILTCRFGPLCPGSGRPKRCGIRRFFFLLSTTGSCGFR